MSAAKNLDELNFTLLIKLMGMTTSSNDGEALTAIRKANATIMRFGRTWDDILSGRVKVIADPFSALTAAPPPPPPKAPTFTARPAPQPTPRQQWTPPPQSPQPPPHSQTYQRTAPPPRPQRTPTQSQPNKFQGRCTQCGGWVAAAAGIAELYNGKWEVRHNGRCPPRAPTAKPVPPGKVTDIDNLI